MAASAGMADLSVRGADAGTTQALGLRSHMVGDHFPGGRVPHWDAVPCWAPASEMLGPEQHGSWIPNHFLSYAWRATQEHSS